MQSSVQNLCPHCRQPAVWSENPDRPFCSARCRLIDLGAWIEESYRIPAEPSPEATEDYEENQ